jgi:hypothetical protein
LALAFALLKKERNKILYNAKGLTNKELNILQANRILSNIKNIIDKVNSLTQIKTGIKISNYTLPYTMESKLFYKYGDK